MREMVFALILGVGAAVANVHSAAADEAADKCAQTETWFNLAVDNRKMGETKGKVRRILRPDMGRNAADQLVDFVYALPDAHLNHEVGAMARQQCEGM